MNTATRSFRGKQIFYAGIGWGSAAVYGPISIWLFDSGGLGYSNWPSYVFLAAAIVGALHAIRNAGLCYVVSAEGIIRKTRWNERELVRWDDVFESKYSAWNRGLSLKSRNGMKCRIRCAELCDSTDVAQLVKEYVGSKT